MIIALFMQCSIIIVTVLPVSARWRRFGHRSARPTGLLGEGLSTLVNPVATRLDAGWNLAGGIGVTRGSVGIMVDAMFNDFGITRDALVRARARRGSQEYWAVTVDPIFHVNERGPVDSYLTGGGGLYSRITKYRASSGLVGQDSGRYDLISSATLYKPRVNGGAGFSCSLGNRSNIKIFAEARYRRMFTRGPSASLVTDRCGPSGRRSSPPLRPVPSLTYQCSTPAPREDKYASTCAGLRIEPLCSHRRQIRAARGVAKPGRRSLAAGLPRAFEPRSVFAGANPESIRSLREAR